MNMTVLFKKYTYGLLLIATTLIGFAFNFSNAGNILNGYDSFKFKNNISNEEVGFLNGKTYCVEYDGSSYAWFSVCNVNYSAAPNSLTCFVSTCNSQTSLSGGPYSIYKFDDGFPIYNSNNSCNPTGNCTVNNKVSENILFSGSKSFSSAGYTNMFNYGNEGAGTYCVNFTSTSPQQLTMGFANGGTTAPSNLYTLYADQYGNTICLYGNKQYFNVKLNSSSNTIDYEVYKLTDLLNDDIPCEETEQETCDYTQYENTINNLSGSLAQCQSENNTLSGNLNTCEGELNSCMAGFGTGDIQRSALFINNIQHLGANRINITIPEEIEREYTNEEDTFNLDVEGYGYDQEKMQSIVNTQFTPPTSEDIENVIKRIADFMPLLAIMLLIVYTWWLIKKAF